MISTDECARGQEEEQEAAHRRRTGLSVAGVPWWSKWLVVQYLEQCSTFGKQLRTARHKRVRVLSVDDVFGW
ncbi:hypothetical protein HXX76_006286 [Chlamydomonas incerta]|uniref:Uncharacterized protein n=1 Tax=Chlamydomonas incerta TaxID=51695 RepID=A0A835T0N1_CHLIN|nr:hypothetical protein HXX76_006286 [Chlamydomonas incerta]|eukprot:KAG2436762.1 hypothetical protein HXX76_006286 [Chlamydomonas incerta]